MDNGFNTEVNARVYGNIISDADISYLEESRPFQGTISTETVFVNGLGFSSLSIDLKFVRKRHLSQIIELLTKKVDEMEANSTVVINPR